MQDVEPDRETLRKLHQTIQKVTDDLDGMRFNTAIAAMMEFTNHLTQLDSPAARGAGAVRAAAEPRSPRTWPRSCGRPGPPKTLAYEPWPTFDAALTKADEIEVPVQVNGKLRGKMTVPAAIDEDESENERPWPTSGSAA